MESKSYLNVCEASEDHKKIFVEWGRASRIEELTCRPIVAGKRIAAEPKLITLAFFLLHGDKPVGKMSFFDFNSRNRSAEFGYMVDPAQRGRGIATQMLRLGLQKIFLGENLNKLYCQTAEFNIPSVKLLKKSGFHLDGTLREHHELDGKLYSDLVFSILRREFEVLEEGMIADFKIPQRCNA